MNLKDIRNYADSIGMYFQSVHAPFGKAADMWRGGEKAETALDELLYCLEDVAGAGLNIKTWDFVWILGMRCVTTKAKICLHYTETGLSPRISTTI